jgi:glycosyltransferase involved in cell wall biosynthesis
LWDEAKNLQLLDRIAPEVTWEIALAGESELENVRAFSGKRLRHLGRLDSGAVGRELGRASIYAAPALYEPFGLAILEAALSGCALVLSDLPTLKENWDGCARFIDADDEQGWIDCLNELSANEVERKRLQSSAHARALTFSPHKQAKSYSDLYRALSEDATAASPQIAFA